MYLRSETYAVELAYLIAIFTLCSQWLEAYGQWLNDEPARLRGELSAASAHTAWGRMLKAFATVSLIVAFLKALHG